MKIEVKGVIISNDRKWIYDWFEEDSTCPRDVAERLEKAKGEPVNVYINSGGGDIFAGSEIYAALLDYPGKVHIHVVGFAGSAASVIACAGESDIAPTAMLMIHNVSGGVQGDYRALNHESEVLQKANRAIAAAYTRKTGKSEEELLALMDDTSYFTAEEAVAMGFIDQVREYQMVAAHDTSRVISPEIEAKLKALLKEPPERTASADFLWKEKAKLNLLRLGGKTK